MSPVERLIQQLIKDLDNVDGQNLTNLAKVFDRSVYKPLQGDIDALQKLLQMEKLGASVRNTTEYKRLMADITTRLTEWQSYMTMTIPQVASNGVTMGIANAQTLIEDGYGITGVFRKSNPEAVEKLMGFLEEGGPLYKRIEMMSDYYPKLIADAITAGVTAGKNPRTIAALLTKHLGMSLTDSLRTMRTVQVWSYREANRASYIANSDVVEGWIWYATLDSDCCMSCIAQHGTFHTNDEVLDDHYNGHCMMIPKVIKGNPGIQTGESWFNTLSEQQQRAYMGDSKYEAWKDGQFKFSQLSKQGHDDVYGTMRTEAPLKDLIQQEIDNG